jgi:hypothetical protein
VGEEEEAPDKRREAGEEQAQGKRQLAPARSMRRCSAS